MHVVNVEALCQALCKPGKPAGDDGCGIAESAQVTQQVLSAVGYHNFPVDLLERRHRQSLQQAEPLPETVTEINFSIHGAGGDCADLIAHAGRFCH